MPLGVLEARMWSVSMVVGVGVPLQAHTTLDMAHLDGREVGHSNMSCARYERCHCEHHMTAKGLQHAFGMAKARVRSVLTGVCGMSTPLRTGAALDMMHFDGREVARARLRDACALGRAVCCEHILSAKGSSVQGGVWAGPE